MKDHDLENILKYLNKEIEEYEAYEVIKMASEVDPLPLFHEQAKRNHRSDQKLLRQLHAEDRVAHGDRGGPAALRHGQRDVDQIQVAARADQGGAQIFGRKSVNRVTHNERTNPAYRHAGRGAAPPSRAD